jgi:hypothetical protein
LLEKKGPRATAPKPSPEVGVCRRAAKCICVTPCLEIGYSSGKKAVV